MIVGIVHLKNSFQKPSHVLPDQSSYEFGKPISEYYNITISWANFTSMRTKTLKMLLQHLLNNEKTVKFGLIYSIDDVTEA